LENTSLRLSKKLLGALHAPASYFMKTSLKQHTDKEVREFTEKFIKKYGKKDKTVLILCCFIINGEKI